MAAAAIAMAGLKVNAKKNIVARNMGTPSC